MPIELPHAWQQAVDVRWEGPAIYRVEVDVPQTLTTLRFSRVSYGARVFVDNEQLADHRGIYDSFDVSLEKYAGQRVQLRVEVTKNGGSSFPVRDVASGFLPYVFHTFGGLCGDVNLVSGDISVPAAGRPRLIAKRSKLYLDGRPWSPRGVLSWGWYPELGHQTPSSEMIAEEIRKVKEFGFNLIKFCLWIPPHEFLEQMKSANLEAWIELPIWDPTSDDNAQTAIFDEMERIVAEYRHHDNIVLWTCGCELSSATSPEFRSRLVEMTRKLANGVLVKDNSGGSEMYGGDPREFGDFVDVHPYAEAHWYPLALDSLQNGPRSQAPILLGEFNDYDTCRDLARIAREAPFWASDDPTLNDQGMRWQMDLPAALKSSPLVEDSDRLGRLVRSSIDKANWVRKFVQEAVRARPDFAGYVVTGLVDTPISNAGFLDEWGTQKQGLDFSAWNRDDVFFLVPSRRPPWIRGGNRPGWQDAFNVASGATIMFRVGMASVSGFGGTGRVWLESGNCLISETEFDASTPEHGSRVVIDWPVDVPIVDEPTSMQLRVRAGDVENEWRIVAYPDPNMTNVHGPILETDGSPFRVATNEGVVECDSLAQAVSIGLERGGAALVESGLPRPFWRESIHEPQSPFGEEIMQTLGWEGALAIAPDRAMSLAKLQDSIPTGASLNVDVARIDTRTFEESAYVATVESNGRRTVVTTFRVQGGHGVQPYGLKNNIAGAWTLRRLLGRESVT